MQALTLLQEVYGMTQCSELGLSSGTEGLWREGVEDDPRSGKPATSKIEENVELVRQKVHGDRRLTVRRIANELDMNCDKVWTIITKNLEMRKICAKMVPKLLKEERKERRVQVCHDILKQLQTETNFQERVITGNESWIFEYDLETERQSLQWKSPTSPRPKKARMAKSKIDDVGCFLWCEGHCARRILATGLDHQPAHLQEFPARFDAVSAREEATNVQKNLGCPTTTMLRRTMHWTSGNFLPKITLLCWSNLHTHQTWLLVILSCFLSSREPRRNTFSWRTSHQNGRVEGAPELSRKDPSRSAWRHGRGGWKSALDLKGLPRRRHVAVYNLYLE